MDSEGYRIKLNLSQFFTDHRKFSYIFLELNEINDFYDLECRIRRIFSISESFIFLIDNVFVPHSEYIKLIHEEETLTVLSDTCLGKNTKSTQNSKIKTERKEKKKRLVCQEGCQGCFHYFQSKSCHVLSPQRKRKKIETLNQCNYSQEASYPCVESDTLIPDCETVEIHGSENEMFLRVNKVYDFDKKKHVDDSVSPNTNKKKVRFKNIKNEEREIVLKEEIIDNETENNSIKDCSQFTCNINDNLQEPDYIVRKQETNIKISLPHNINETSVFKNKLGSHNIGNSISPMEISGEDHIRIEAVSSNGTLNCDYSKIDEKEFKSEVKVESDANIMRNQDEGQNYNLSENCGNVNNREISVSAESCNSRMNNILINDVPILTNTINVENRPIRKRTRIRTRRRKGAVPDSPNITGLPIPIHGANPHIWVTDNDFGEYSNKTSCKISSTGEKFKENREDKCINQNYIVEAEDNVLNKTLDPSHTSEFLSPVPSKCDAFLARIKTPNAVDIFREVLTPPVVLKKTSCTSKTPQELTAVDEEQPIIIDCYDDDDGDGDCINLEKYPLINSSPRKGDILAFKLNRVTPDGTSHVTEYIIAEVVKYCEGTSQIIVRVQRGQDQLQEPRKRFYLFDDVEESCHKNDTYEFNWNELLETRLLFP